MNASRGRLVVGCSRGRRSGEPICTRSRTTRTSSAIASLGTFDSVHRDRLMRSLDAIVDPVYPLPKPGHAPARSLARCTATVRLEPSQPGWCDLSFPRHLHTSGAHGVHLLFAGLIPPAGDRPSLADRAHLPFHSASARLIFVGLISPLIMEKMRASNRAANRGKV